MLYLRQGWRLRAALIVVVAGLLVGLPAREPVPAASQGAGPVAPDPHLLFVAGVASAVTAPDGETSHDLIDAAVENGVISKETGLVYRVYADFGDPRLPAKFRGDDSTAPPDSDALAEAGAAYNALSPAARAALDPFFLPPADPGSWWYLQEGEAPLLAAGVEASAVPAQWGYRDAATANVRVFFEAKFPGDAARAAAIANEVETVIWPKLVALFGRSPLPDAGTLDPYKSGGDGRIDIYLLGAVNRAETPSYNHACKKAPAYINAPRDVSFSTVAHELVHAFQWGFDVEVGCFYPGDYAWWAEATATWAEHYVYPGSNEEQQAAAFLLPFPGQPLDLKNDRHEYGAYLFALYLAQKLGAAVIGDSWKAAEEVGTLQAIDKAINDAGEPGGFNQFFKEWVASNLNRFHDNLLDDYFEWDGLEAGAETRRSPLPVIGAAFGARDWKTLGRSTGIPRLSSTYTNWYINDPTAQLVEFFNGWSYRLDRLVDPQTGVVTFETTALPDPRGLGVQVALKIGGVWQVRDWTEVASATFCRSKPGENVEEFILIHSNARPDLQPVTFAGNGPTLQLSKSCGAVTTNFAGHWTSVGTCPNPAAPWRWEVTLAQSPTGAVTGTIKYHNCPDGGRVTYNVTGQATTAPTVQLQANKTDSLGDLGDTTPPSVTITIGPPPSPPTPNYTP